MDKGSARRLAAALLVCILVLAAIPILVAIYRQAEEYIR